MRLFEYQGKELFNKYGIPVPHSILCGTPEEVADAFDGLTHPVVIKAQVLTGGRGKAGGVVTVSNSDEARMEAKRILELRIGGEKPSSLLVEESSAHKQELYLAVTLDRGKRTFVVITSKGGGIDVESGEDRIVAPIPLDGLRDGEAEKLAEKLSLKETPKDGFRDILTKLEGLSRAEECELAEINPLAIDSTGHLLALDSKVILDDNALFRHPEFSSLEPEDPLEGEAAREGFALVRLDGDIAVVGNGAGLVLSTLDLVADEGGKPACFLDLGGGSQRDRVEAALRLVGKLPNAKRILVNIFGGITRTTDVAEGLRTVINSEKVQPVYARISGAEEQEARKILAETPLKLYPTAADAVRGVVRES